MRAGEVSAVLARDAEGVAMELLPAGTRKGRRWVVGGTDNDRGKSLSVVLDGPKAGQWSDFATDQGGDLLDLWQEARGVTLVQAMDEACKFAGIQRPKLERRKNYTRPEKPRCAKVRNELREYLAGRGISDVALEEYAIADNGREIVFPSLRDGELVAVKYRTLDKQFRTEKDQEPCLFGWQAVPGDARAVVITEGEIDALTWASWGVPALSVPHGGGGGNKQQWIENEFDHLARFDSIYLSLDADEQGQAAVADIVSRLGRERCYLVELPEKDANASMQAGFTAEQAAAAIESARTMDPEELRSAGEYRAEVLAEMFDRKDAGIRPPWRSIEDRLRFRRGELIVLAGATGHGKSRVAGHLTVDAISQGVRACVASMEFKPARWLRDLTLQAGLTGR